ANGGQVDIAPLNRLDLVLGKYVIDDMVANAIRTAISKELKQVLDYRRRPVNVLRELPGGRIEFNIEITSEFTQTNVDGTPRRNFVVPGVILSSDEFKQLTQAAMLQEITVD